MDNTDVYIAIVAGVGCLWQALQFIRRGWAAVSKGLIGGLALILIVCAIGALLDSHLHGTTLGEMFGWTLMAIVVAGVFWVTVSLVGAGLGLLLRDSWRAWRRARSDAR